MCLVLKGAISITDRSSRYPNIPCDLTSEVACIGIDTMHRTTEAKNRCDEKRVVAMRTSSATPIVGALPAKTSFRSGNISTSASIPVRGLRGVSGGGNGRRLSARRTVGSSVQLTRAIYRRLPGAPSNDSFRRRSVRWPPLPPPIDRWMDGLMRSMV